MTLAQFPRSRTLARTGWALLTLLIVGLTLAGVPGRYAQLYSDADSLSLLELGFSPRAYAIYLTSLDLLVVAAHVVIATLIVWRRRDWMAQYVGIALVSGGALLPLSTMYARGGQAPLAGSLVELVSFIGLATGLTTLYVFPSGRFVPRASAALAGLWAAAAFGIVFLDEQLVGLPLTLQVLVPLFFAFTGIFAQIYRYTEVSNPVERQQTKWAVFGLALAVLGPVVFVLPIVVPSLGQSDAPSILYRRVGFEFFTVSLVLRVVASTVLAFMLTLFPISFAVAILRYRLWDIDFYVSRALAYGASTATLALMYLVGATVLQRILEGFTMDRLGFIAARSEQLTVIGASLAIAAVFNPVRARVQRQIDRRFYRQRYDAARTTAEFGEVVRARLEIDDLGRSLLDTVDASVRPEHLSFWMRSPRARGSP